MTTKHSPLSKLRKQADTMAMVLKMVERGDKVPVKLDPQGKLAHARRTSPDIVFAIVVDYKIMKVTMGWQTIATMTERGISEFLLKQMRESREAVH